MQLDYTLLLFAIFSLRLSFFYRSSQMTGSMMIFAVMEQGTVV